MDKNIFHYKFSVRGYELDSFGHVNNAVYMQYFEQARWEILNELGLLELFQKSGGFLVVIDAQIRYVNELKIFEEATIDTTMHIEGPFLLFKHRMVSAKETKSRATFKCLFISKDKTPLDVPKLIVPFTHEQTRKN